MADGRYYNTECLNYYSECVWGMEYHLTVSV